MLKNPAFQFYPNDWTRDLEEHPLEIEGAWIRLCCKLWWSYTKGKMTRTITQWSKILREPENETNRILEYIKNERIGDISSDGNGNVTVISRRMISDEKIRENTKLRVQKYREKQYGNAKKSYSNKNVHCSSSSSSSSCTKVQIDNCPQNDLVDLWHTSLQELPKVRQWTPAHQANLRSRWNEDPKRQSLKWWKDLFLYIRGCPFLMGEIPPSKGHQQFFLRLRWLVKADNFVKVIEGDYEGDKKSYE